MANALPFLVGSAYVVAQSYPDQTLAYVTYVQWQLIALLFLVLLLGVIGELFVPTLPLGIPRRGFGVYSWFALFQSQVREPRRLVKEQRGNLPLIFRSYDLRHLGTLISS